MRSVLDRYQRYPVRRGTSSVFAARNALYGIRFENPKGSSHLISFNDNVEQQAQEPQPQRPPIVERTPVEEMAFMKKVIARGQEPGTHNLHERVGQRPISSYRQSQNPLPGEKRGIQRGRAV
jgi:hypothetical protein